MRMRRGLGFYPSMGPRSAMRQAGCTDVCISAMYVGTMGSCGDVALDQNKVKNRCILSAHLVYLVLGY